MWKPIFRHDKGLIEKIAIYTLIRKSNAITLPPCIIKKEVDEGFGIFEEAATMAEKEQGLR